MKITRAEVNGILAILIGVTIVVALNLLLYFMGYLQ